MIDPGWMRHRVEIQVKAATRTRDTFGQVTDAFATVGTVWAYIEPLEGREAIIAAQVSPDVTHKVTMRLFAGLTPKHRLKFGARLFNIESVRNIDEQGQQMVLMAKEQV